MTRCKRCGEIIEPMTEYTVELWLGYGGDSTQVLEGEYCSNNCLGIELSNELNNIPRDRLDYVRYVS